MTTRIRLTRAIIASVAASALLMPDVALVAGQAPGAPSGVASDKGAVIGTGTFTGFVENMDRSLAFYRDAFGMEVPPLPASGERPYNNPNPRLLRCSRSRAHANGISPRACPAHASTWS